MDLDALAGVVAYKHTGEGVTTVTAAVDRIIINHPLKELCDLQLSGQVTFATGRSSMEVSLQVAKAPGKDEEIANDDIFMTCAFTMVSLDPQTRRPVAVNPLKLDTAQERTLYALGEQNYNDKKALARRSLEKIAPNDEESEAIHTMWLEGRSYSGMHVSRVLVLSMLRTRRISSRSSDTKTGKHHLHGQHSNSHNADHATTIS